MSGWLAAFAERGLARHDPATDRWVAVQLPGQWRTPV